MVSHVPLIFAARVPLFFAARVPLFFAAEDACCALRWRKHTHAFNQWRKTAS
jgi:hypothetical protein